MDGAKVIAESGPCPLPTMACTTAEGRGVWLLNLTLPKRRSIIRALYNNPMTLTTCSKMLTWNIENADTL